MRTWDEAAETEFGMRWGPVEVTRAARFPEGKGAALQIKTDGGVLLTLYVSERGRVVKVIAEHGNVKMKERNK